MGPRHMYVSRVLWMVLNTSRRRVVCTHCRRTADMHDCQLGSFAYYYGPNHHSQGNHPSATPSSWCRGFPTVITSPEQSAGWYALELYVRHARTPDASRAAAAPPAHRRISAHAQSTPSRAHRAQAPCTLQLGPVRGWLLLYFLIARAHDDAYHCRHSLLAGPWTWSQANRSL